MDDLFTERACGRRVKGGVYAETRPSESGVPVEFFIVDPPRPVDLAALGLTAVGVKLVEVNSVWHVFDVVGQEYYPYTADYIEETRQKGASRRLPGNLDYPKLSPDSHLFLIHQKAIIENFPKYPQLPAVTCPKGLEEHQAAPLPSMCAGRWWYDLPAKERQLPGGVKYCGSQRPPGVSPVYQHGVFLIMPITNLVVINGGEDTEKNHEAASKSGLPVYLEEE